MLGTLARTLSLSDLLNSIATPITKLFSSSIFPAPVPVTYLPSTPHDNDYSTRQTIEQMISLTNSAASNPAFQSFVIHNIIDPSLYVTATELELVREVFYWVKRNVRYMTDEEIMSKWFGVSVDNLDKDLLISPLTLIQMSQPMGDCDDFSMLIAAMLKVLNIKSRFVTIAADDLQPDRFSHVYLRVMFSDGTSLAVDGSFGSYVGWESNVSYKKVEWAI